MAVGAREVLDALAQYIFQFAPSCPARDWVCTFV
jgi:hypothetical protein